MECAELMRHGVHYAEERIRKRHTCHCCCICHLFARFGIRHACAGTVVCSGEIFEYILECTECKTVRVVGRHHGSICLKAVADSVDTGCGGESSRCAHHHVCVHDCHLGHELIVGKRVLDSGVFVCDDRERCYFGACAGRCRDGNEICLVAHVREGVDSLADVHEAHCHVKKVCFGMLIEHPHDLACVHCGAAADCDNAVGLERRHELCAFDCTAQRGVGRDIRECGMHDSHGIELVFDGLCEAAAVKEAVGYDECLLLVHDGAQLVESDRQTALLDIYLFRRSEPQHVFSPLRHGLDVDKMLHADVFGHGVAAP
ncbi:unknown [Ruminococcus sp. CAG:382]|nr:unknown [Ruminococcus sp. CAG:382]